MLKRKSRVALASDSEGSDGSDGDNLKKKTRVQDDEDATSDSGDEWGSKGGAKKKVLTKKVSSPRSSGNPGPFRSGSEGVEEGELPGGSSDGLDGSSDDDSGRDSDESEEFNDGYDENLLGDDDDRARLAEMTEKEREQEIFNRIEKRERLKARFEIEKKLRQAKKKRESKAREEQQLEKEGGLKDKSFTDVSMRSKERKKNLEGRQDKKSQAIQNLRAEREKKKKAEEERKEKEDTEKESSSTSKRDKDKERDKADKVERDTGKKLKASDIYSDDDSDGSDSSASRSSSVSSKASRRSRSKSRSRSRSRGSHSRSRGSRSKSRSSSRSRSRSRSKSGSRSSDSSSADSTTSRRSVEKVVFAKDHISQIRLSRFRLEKWLFAPFFAKTVIGCFVRIGIGQKGGESVYRVAEILDVVETPKVYQLGKNRTNKGLRIKHGKDERVFRIEYVSNQDFTDAEFAKWMEVMATDSLSLPTISSVERKKRDVDAANNHSYSVADINQIVLEKKKFKRNPHNYAMAKTEVMKKKEMAEQMGDVEEARKWSEELERLEDRAKELDKQRTSTISAIQYINERNRQKNIVDIEKAILEDAKKNKLRADDPFTRRKCAPSLVTKKHGGSDKLTSEQLKTLEEARKRDAELRKAAEDAKRKEDEEDARKEKDKAKSGVLGAANGGDLFAAHDFDIAIDLDASIPTPTAHHAVRTSLGSTTNALLRESAPRRSLNIEEYKKKRGFM